MRKLVASFLALVVVLAPDSASGQISLGAQGNWGDTFDWGVGGRLTVDLSQMGTPLAFFGTYDYFWPEDSDLLDRQYWEININAVYAEYIGGPQAQPYAGIGLNIAHTSVKGETLGGLPIDRSETNYGINALAGFKWKLTRVAPYIEFRYVIEGSRQLVITGGLDLAVAGIP